MVNVINLKSKSITVPSVFFLNRYPVEYTVEPNQ